MKRALIGAAALSAFVGGVVATQQTPTRPAGCHYHWSDSSDPLMVLPDPACTPGVRNPQVTQASIAGTICKTGWTATVRPPESVTAKIKKQALIDYGVTAGSTELDHLLPLEVGGAPADPRNLWPEPNYAKPPAPYVHNPKDLWELQIRNAVCRGKITLAAAQTALLSNWTTAPTVLGLKPQPVPPLTPTGATTPTREAVRPRVPAPTGGR